MIEFTYEITRYDKNRGLLTVRYERLDDPNSARSINMSIPVAVMNSNQNEFASALDDFIISQSVIAQEEWKKAAEITGTNTSQLEARINQKSGAIGESEYNRVVPQQPPSKGVKPV